MIVILEKLLQNSLVAWLPNCGHTLLEAIMQYTGLKFDALCHAVHSYLEKGSSCSQQLVKCADDLRRSKCESFIVDLIHQQPNTRWTVYEAFPIAVINKMITREELCYFEVPVSSGAYKDEDDIRIVRELKRLEPPFVASFRGRTEDFDGFFSWDEPLSIMKQRGAITYVPPRKVPLEIGYTQGVTTLLHIQQRGGIARWPYGSSLISVLLTLDSYDV